MSCPTFALLSNYRERDPQKENWRDTGQLRQAEEERDEYIERNIDIKRRRTRERCRERWVERDKLKN